MPEIDYFSDTELLTIKIIKEIGVTMMKFCLETKLLSAYPI